MMMRIKCKQADILAEDRTPLPNGQLSSVRGHDACINASKFGCSTSNNRRTPRKRLRVKTTVRFPFRTLLPKYIRAVAPYKAKSTLANERRILWRIADIIEPIDEEHPLPEGLHSSPKKIRKSEVDYFVSKMKELELKSSTMKKYTQYLENYLVWCGNPIISKMRQLRYVHFPREVEDEIPSLTDEQLEAIGFAALEIDGWKGSVARMMAAIYHTTGLRPSELRTQRLADVDTHSHELRVSRPKAEGLYGKHRTVPILEHVWPVFESYLAEREEYLASRGVEEHEALFPYCDTRGKVRYFSHNEWLKIKDKLEERSGVTFELRHLRSTFCQKSFDNGSKHNSVSKVMGHGSTATTERYYGRIRDKAACSDIRRAWKEAHAQSMTKCVMATD